LVEDGIPVNIQGGAVGEPGSTQNPEAPQEKPQGPKPAEEVNPEGEKPKEIEKIKNDWEKLPEKLKSEKLEKPEIKEGKFEIKEGKPEKLEKPEKEKPEKEHKLEKLEIKEDKPEMEKPPVPEKGIKDGGEVPQPPQAAGPLPIDRESLLRHAEALEKMGRDLRHFIEQSERPDLTHGALDNEPDQHDQPQADT
jgi:hypothetical protein